jgi:hypothetical protein
MTPLDVVLDDVAAPLMALRRFGAPHALQLAAALWNIARLPDSVPRQTLVIAVARSVQDELEPAVADAFVGAYRRAAERYGQDPRMVVELPA